MKFNQAQLNRLNKKIKKLDEKAKTADKDLFKYASSVRRGIQERTMSGVDAYKRAFEEYRSEAYKTFKSKYRDTSKVTLTYTFAMLGSITIKKLTKGFRFYFPDATQRAKAERHNSGLSRMPKRYFFALDDGQVNRILKDFFNGFIKVLK